MPGRRLEIIIRAGAGEGATIGAVLDKLGALANLYESTASALLRPGAGRVAIPEAVKEVLALRVTGAQATNSLGVALAEPAVAPDYEGDYAELPVVGQFEISAGASAKFTHSRRTAAAIRGEPWAARMARILLHPKEGASW